MFVIDMFRQAFHTYNQSWKKLMFFSVDIGLIIDIISKYIISYWGYHILSEPLTPGSSISTYVLSHLGTLFPPLVYLLALFNSALYVVAPIFYILPILYLLINPETCQPLNSLQIFKRTAPYRKSITLFFLFLFIADSIFTIINVIFPIITFSFYNLNYIAILFLSLLVIFITVVIEGTEVAIVKDGLAVLPALQAFFKKIFSLRFFLTLLLIAIMHSCYHLLIYFLFPSLSAPDHFAYFMQSLFDAFYYPLDLYIIYFALFRPITKKETNITP